MVSRLWWLAATLLVGLSACGNGDGVGPTTGPDADFHPNANVTLSGDVTYKSVRIPAGVTVTASVSLILTVVEDVTIAGTLSAPCHALTIAANGLVTVTGTVSNSCGVPEQRGSRLVIIGKGGYDFEGAHVNGSGDIVIVDGPNLNPSPPATAAAVRVGTEAHLGGPYRCKLVDVPVQADFPKPQDPSNPNGTDGNDFIDGCGQAFSGQTGGNLLIKGVTVTGRSGLDGTSVSSGAFSVGGNGGAAGAIIFSADGDVDLDGINNFNGGNGGDGGNATAVNTTEGGNATAIGGHGGGVKPANGGSPVKILSSGTITVSGTLNVHLGHGGAGGGATARSGPGAPGNPGGKGGNASSSAGNGGDGQSADFHATGSVVFTSQPVVTGGDPGPGGNATTFRGNGGAGTTLGAAGGPGGDGTIHGGKGGKGVNIAALRAVDGVGNLVLIAQAIPGGAGGNVDDSGGNGGAAAACPNPGAAGKGGKGGDLTGAPGAGGDGPVHGTAGKGTISNASNGGKGGGGTPTGGDGGKAGVNGTSPPTAPTASSPQGSTGDGTYTVTNSFGDGDPGDGCPNPAPHVDNVQMTGGDPTTGNVSIRVNGAGLLVTSEVRYNGVVLPTTCVVSPAPAQGSGSVAIQANCVSIEAVIGPTVVNPAAIADLIVVNPPPGGGTSNAVAFTHPCTPHVTALGTLVNGGLSQMSCPRGGRWTEVYQEDLNAVTSARLLMFLGWASRVWVENQIPLLVSDQSAATGPVDRGFLLPPTSGKYNFTVSASDGSAAGAFSFQVVAAPAPSTCNNIPTILVGAQTSQQLMCEPSAGNFRDQFIVVLQANEQINVDESGTFPASLRIVDGTTGQVVRQDNNNGHLLTAHMNFTATGLKAYVIQVFNQNVIGTYQLFVHH